MKNFSIAVAVLSNFEWIKIYYVYMLCAFWYKISLILWLSLHMSTVNSNATILLTKFVVFKVYLNITDNYQMA